ncbi:MAG TPA: Fic family protein [Solirubrobacterales bacterium]
MPKEVQPLDPAELAEIDAQYRPFPSFEDWPKDLPGADAWEHSRSEFEEISRGSTDADLKEAQTVAMRAAAFDTGAIEGLYSTDRGLTMTVATQAAAWEQEVAKQGPDARALFEAQLSAFELVLDQVTERFPKITQVWIRRLHDEITAPQETYKVHTPLGVQEQPLPRGEYKVYPNHVLTESGDVHAYAPVDQTQAEMQRLVDEVDTPAFRDAHPVIQASYVHYVLAAIHPFADGNGRVARAAASAYTYRAASIPLLVLVDRRDAYLSALARADTGNAVDFIDLIGSVTREAMELVMDSLLTARAPQPEEQIRRFSDLYREEDSDLRLDKAAAEFSTWLTSATKRQADSLSLPDTVRLEIRELKGAIGNPPHGFRHFSEPDRWFMLLRFSSAPPAMAEIDRVITIFLSKSSSDLGSLRLQVPQTPAEHLELAFRDLSPQLSSTAQLRADNFLRRVIGEGFEALYKEAGAGLSD